MDFQKINQFVSSKKEERLNTTIKDNIN